MFDTDVQRKWKKWYPQEIALKKNENVDNVLYDLGFLTKKDFHIIKKFKNDQNENNQMKNISNESTDKNLYKLGFQDGFQKQIENNKFLKNKLNILCKSLDHAIYEFEKILFSRLLKTALIFSSYIIGEKIDIDKSILSEKIRNTINSNTFLIKPKLFIHPNNKKILEKILVDSLSSYKFQLVYSTDIDINGFKIQSENSNLENTINARYKELSRLIYSEEF